MEAWFKKQYVHEVQDRYGCQDHTKHSRLLMITRWRLAPDISVWSALPGETIPTKLAKPNPLRVMEDAELAWKRADKQKAQELYDKWHHTCTDPYYCPMHGIGSD